MAEEYSKHEQESTGNDNQEGALARQKMTDAKQDPRFDTFAKRLTFFQWRDEPDKEFAKRCGVSYSTLRRWKYQGKTPNLLSTLMFVSNRLDVFAPWLGWGMLHSVDVLPNGSFALTSIPKFSPWWHVTHDPRESEATQHGAPIQ
jgi:hypothetical protein